MTHRGEDAEQTRSDDWVDAFQHWTFSALMAADDDPVLSSSEHGLDKPERSEATLEGVELVAADPPGVGGVRAEVVDRNGLAAGVRSIASSCLLRTMTSWVWHGPHPVWPDVYRRPLSARERRSKSVWSQNPQAQVLSQPR